jgi:pilus assembly protein CpaB
LLPGRMRWQVWPSEAAGSASYIKRKSRPAAVEQLGNAVVRKKFVAGEPILEDKVIRAGSSGYMAALLPPGIRAISIPITPETGAGGFILPNDHVDVLLTRAEKHATGEHYTSETILPNVRVLAIDQTVEEKNGQRVVVGKIATLALSARDAESLALATRLGSLSLVLRSMSDVKPTGPDAANARTSINIIRFGMASGSTR